jgi:hypothetical protein
MGSVAPAGALNPLPQVVYKLPTAPSFQPRQNFINGLLAGQGIGQLVVVPQPTKAWPSYNDSTTAPAYSQSTEFPGPYGDWPDVAGGGPVILAAGTRGRISAIKRVDQARHIESHVSWFTTHTTIYIINHDPPALWCRINLEHPAGKLSQAWVSGYDLDAVAR